MVMIVSRNEFEIRSLDFVSGAVSWEVRWLTGLIVGVYENYWEC